MAEEKDHDRREKRHILRFYLVKYQAPPYVVQKQEAEKQLELIKRDQLRINKEIDRWKAKEYKINQKVMWFSRLDEEMKFRKRQIKNLEWCLGKVEPSLPFKSVPRTTGFFLLSEKDSQILVRPNKKRYQKDLIKKGRIDFKYLQIVHEELLSSKKSDGMTSCDDHTQELNDLVESMVQKIRHGNMKHVDEMKIYHEIRNFSESREMCASLDRSSPHSHWYNMEKRSSKEVADSKRSIQHQINLRLEDIERIKRDQMGRKSKVRTLEAKLEHVSRNIKSLHKELENINSMKLEAYKHACTLRKQKKELNSCYSEHLLLKAHAKRLARKRDTVGLKQLCDTQVEGFMGQWSKSKAYREDYEKRKLVSRG